jgi:hypothetical protein
MSDPYDRWLQPQDWIRDGGHDPVIGLGAEGAFDDMHLFAPCAFYEAGQYRMYYPGSRGDVAGRVFRLGHASSADGVAFDKHPERPVFEVGDDAHSVLTPALLRRGCGEVVREIDRLRLWFCSTHFADGTGRHTLHDTTSGDGFTWDQPSAPQLEACYAPSVLKVGDTYHLWYSDVSADPWSVRHAISADGASWDVEGEPCVVLDQAWEHKRLFYPYVLNPEDGLFVMWYGSYRQMEPMMTALGVAVSRDGTTWEKSPHNPIFGPDGLSREWESHYTTSQSVVRTPEGRWRMWYGARPQPPFVHKYFAIGTASWDGPGD